MKETTTVSKIFQLIELGHVEELIALKNYLIHEEKGNILHAYVDGLKEGEASLLPMTETRTENMAKEFWNSYYND